MKCDGYLPTIKQLKEEASNRGILPRIKKTSTTGSPNLLVPISAATVVTPQEQRYFDLFCGQTSFEIMPEHDTFATRQMLLQACYSDKSLKHAVVALGALDKTAETTRDFNRLSLDNVPKAMMATANEHHRFALEEYTKAVAEMKTGVTKDVRSALLSILLIFIFEAWNGNMAMAIRQIHNGIRILQEWKSTIKGADKTPEGMSPAPNIIEHDLFRIYGRLAIQVTYFFNEDFSDVGSLGAVWNNLGREYLDSMPASFTTIAEATNFHQAVFKRGVLFFSVYISDPASPNSALAAGLASEQQYTAAKAAQWLKAFEPLYQAFKSGYSMCEGRLVRTAKAHILCAHLVVCTVFSNQMVYDTYNHIFAEVVSLLEESLAMQPAYGRSRPTNYSLAGRAVAVLWITGVRCRDKAIRRKVIELLIKYPRREGVWDGLFVAKIVKFIMDLEEQYIEDDIVPGWARIATLRWDSNLEKRTAALSCEQRISSSSDKVVRKTGIIVW